MADHTHERRQCASCGELNPDAARFCLGCGRPLDAEAPPDHERKIVTFLFIDVAGSTEIAERLEAEVLRDVLLRYYRAVSEVVESHGGTTEKFIGDAVVAVFGLPRVREDDAHRAVRAALEVQDGLADLNADLRSRFDIAIEVRIGINTGEVVTEGTKGSSHSLLAADMLNVAARLEQSAPPGGILIGDATAQLVRRDIPLVHVGDLSLKGKSAPVAAWRPQEGGTAEAPKTRFVGRQSELQTLEAALARTVADHSPRLVTIVAPAGGGKTRLAAEFIERCEGRGHSYSGRCLPYGEGITFWPLREVIVDLAGGGSVDPDALTARIRALISADEEAAAIAALVVESVGLSEGATDPHEIFWAVRRLFESVARDRPLMIVWEDLHWAEDTLLRLVRHVVRHARGPILFVGLARPELLERARRWRAADDLHAIVQLSRLSDDDVDRLIGEILDVPLDEDTRRRIITTADGNPLYAQEIARMIVESPAIALADDLPIPATVNAVIAARIDGLPRGAKSILQRASVIGAEFDAEALPHLSRRSEDNGVAADLSVLEDRGLIERRSGDLTTARYAFSHILVRDVTYATVAKAQRADMHALFAEWLEGLEDHRRGYEEILGYHFESAFNYKKELREREEACAPLAERAGRHLAVAGRRAVARGDMVAAAKLLGRAYVLIQDRSRRLETMLELLFPLRQVGRIEEARALLQEVKDLASTIDDTRVGARAELIEQFWKERNDEWANDARVQIQRARIVFHEVGDAVGSAIAALLATDVDRYEGRYAAAVKSAEQALTLARRTGDARTMEGAFRRIAWGNVFGPAPVDIALARCQTVIASTEFPGLKANTMLAMGVLHAMAGRAEEAHALAAEGRLVLEDLGAALAVAHIPILYGHIHLFTGDIDAAQVAFRSALDALQAWGQGDAAAEIAWAAVCLGRVLFEQARFEEARAALEMSALAVASSHVNVRADRTAVEARLHLQGGDSATAEQRVRDALELANRTDDPKARGDVALDAATVLRARRLSEEAEVLVAFARAAYAGKGIVLLERQAEAVSTR